MTCTHTLYNTMYMCSMSYAVYNVHVHGMSYLVSITTIFFRDDKSLHEFAYNCAWFTHGYARFVCIFAESALCFSTNRVWTRFALMRYRAFSQQAITYVSLVCSGLLQSSKRHPVYCACEWAGPYIYLVWPRGLWSVPSIKFRTLSTHMYCAISWDLFMSPCAHGTEKSGFGCTAFGCPNT